MRLILAVWLVALLAGGAAVDRLLEYKLGVFALWTFAVSLFQANFLVARLKEEGQASPLVHLPVSDAFIFRWLSQKFLLRSLWTWVDYLVAFGFLAFAAGVAGTAAWAWVPFFAAVQWALTLALAAMIARHLPDGSPYAVLAMLGLGAVFMVLTINLRWLAPPLASWIEGSANWLTLVLPTGWMPTLFHRTVVRGEWMTMLIFGPVGLTLYAGFKYWKGVFRTFDSTPITIAEPPPEYDEESPGPAYQPLNAPGPTEVQEGIATREFLAPTEWKSVGVQERFVLNRLTPREKLLTEVALGDEPNWSGRWW